MTGKHWIRVAALAVLLAGCGGKGPQRPSQRLGLTPKVDSAQLALMEMNYRLAEAADAEVMRLALAQEEPYALYEAKTWVRMLDRGQADRPLQWGDTCSVHMRTYDLDGRLLADVEQEVVIGKMTAPIAVERNLIEMHRGARVKMLAPWYSAYGMQGAPGIAPYKNVMIELAVGQ